MTMFSPTHYPPDTGMETWPSPDPNAPSGPRLDPGQGLQQLEVRGSWSRVRRADGWEGWVDGRRLVPAVFPSPSPPTAPTAVVTQVAPTAQYSTPTWPAGWYPDPAAPGTIIWWDGTRWTGDRRSASPTASTATTGTTPASGRTARLVVPTIISIVLAVSAFLPWTSSHGLSSSSFKAPVKFLYDYKNFDPRGLKIGHLVVLLAVLVFACSLVPALTKVSRAMSGLAIAIATVFVVQLQRVTHAAGTGDNVFNVLGIGVYVTVVAGVGGIVAPRLRRARRG
jgi:hypothetical protein